MSFVLLALASIVIVFGPQAVLSRFDSITFSPVEQCSNFTVLFSGGQPPAALPLSLTVVPFNLTPVVIGIADSAWNNITLEGAAITFLPFPAGTEFVASLDGADGISAAAISGVITVQASASDGCIPDTTPPPRRYTVHQPITQCEDFDVTYEPSIVDTPPTIRAFAPNATSFYVNQSTNTGAPGRTSYTMDALEGQQIVLMLSDDTDTLEATNLFTVCGNGSSASGCLPGAPTASASPIQSPSQSPIQNSDKQHGNSKPEQMNLNSSEGKLSKPAMIAIGVACGCIVGGIALAMVLWSCREQRRVRRRRLQNFEKTFTILTDPRQDTETVTSPNAEAATIAPTLTYRSTASSFPPPIPLPKTPPTTFRNARDSRALRSATIASRMRSSEMGPGFVRDPIYTNDFLDLLSPVSGQFDPKDQDDLVTSSSFPFSSIPIPLVSPSPIRVLSGQSALLEASIGNAYRGSLRPSSLSSDDIEHILDMATMYSGPTTPTSTIDSSSYSKSSFPQSQAAGGAGNTTIASSLALPRRPTYLLRPSPAATPVTTSAPQTGLLTPNSASLQREPPQAPMPSSPLPSPTGSRYLPSTDGQSDHVVVL